MRLPPYRVERGRDDAQRRFTEPNRAQFIADRHGNQVLQGELAADALRPAATGRFDDAGVQEANRAVLRDAGVLEQLREGVAMRARRGDPPVSQNVIGHGEKNVTYF